jgi:hypothetical protein
MSWILTAAKAICPLCECALQIERPASPPHWGLWRCPVCKKNRGWVPTPPEELHGWVMPMGRNKGLTLSTIAGRTSGVEYLRWCAENLKDTRLRKVIATYLQQLEAEAEKVSV